MPEWEYRYFSYNSKWDKSEEVASMKNGEGDEYYLLFNERGVVGKVLMKNFHIDDHLVQLNKIPKDFESFYKEVSFKLDSASFYFWYLVDKKQWKSTSLNFSDSSPLDFLTNGPAFYHKWAEEYYERKLDIKDIEKIFNYEPISGKLLSKLSDNQVTLEDLEEDLQEIGYGF